jgi:hypothetical protein
MTDEINGRCLNRDTVQELSRPRKALVRLAGVSGKTPKGHLSNSSLERYLFVAEQRITTDSDCALGITLTG